MANIAINSVATRVQFIASSSQTTFSYTFPIKADTDLKVYQRSATSSADDANDILEIVTDYTVTGANTAAGGTVVLVVGATTGDIITIVGDKDIDRTAIYDQSVTLKKSDLNNDFNDNVMYDKQIETEFDQLGIRFNRSERITPTYRQDNLKLPILDNNEIWIGRGDAGDDTDDVTTALVSTITGLVLNEVDYVIGTAEALLPNAQVMGDLSSGLVKNTTAASVGTFSIATAGTDYFAPGGPDIPVADGGTGASTAAAALTSLISGTPIATATVAATDKVIIQDTDDSNNIKTVTAQSIADLSATGVTGPGSSTDNAIARWDGTGGTAIQDSLVTVNDSGTISGVTRLNVDNLRIDGNSITSQDSNGNINLTPNGTGEVSVDARGLYVDPGSDTDASLLTVAVDGAPEISWIEAANGFRMNKGVIIGTAGDLSHTISGATVNADMEIHSEDAQDLGGLTLHRHTNTAAYGGHIMNLRSNGTHASPTIVADNNVLAKFIGCGYDGTDYEQAAEIRMLVDGTPANNVMPGEIKFLTNAGSQALTERMAIDAAGKILWPTSSVLDWGAGNVTLTHSTGLLTMAGGNFSIGTSAKLTAGNIELGAVSDTTLTRASAGDVEIEGNLVYRAGGTDVPVTDGGTGNSSATAYAVLCGGTTSTGAHQSIAGVGTSGHVLTSNGAGALPTFQSSAGSAKVAQIVSMQDGSYTTGTTTMGTGSIPTKTSGVEFLTLSITPTATDSTLHILVKSNLSLDGGDQCSGALFQDTTTNALAATTQRWAAANQNNFIVLQHAMTSGTTSSTTFKFRAGPETAGTIRQNGGSSSQIFGGVADSGIVIVEYLA